MAVDADAEADEEEKDEEEEDDEEEEEDEEENDDEEEEEEEEEAIKGDEGEGDCGACWRALLKESCRPGGMVNCCCVVAAEGEEKDVCEGVC